MSGSRLSNLCLHKECRELNGELFNLKGDHVQDLTCSLFAKFFSWGRDCRKVLVGEEHIKTVSTQRVGGLSLLRQATKDNSEWLFPMARPREIEQVKQGNKRVHQYIVHLPVYSPALKYIPVLLQSPFPPSYPSVQCRLTCEEQNTKPNKQNPGPPIFIRAHMFSSIPETKRTRNSPC